MTLPAGREFFRQRHNGDGHAVTTDGDYEDCACGAMYQSAPAVLDASGRFIAPPQTDLQARPSGPWDGNGKP